MKESNCLLEEDVNRCPHYDYDKHECRDSIKECGMYNKPSIVKSKNTYIRKPRWYEKYYNKNSFIR